MSSWLRYASAPFLLLFDLSVLCVGGYLLDATGIWSLPITVIESVFDPFGPVGAPIEIVLAANLILIALLILVSVPLYAFARDVRKTLRRFGLVRDGDDRDPAARYVERTREVFVENPDVAVFLYGHTYRASVTEVDDRVVVNTGTWLKRFRRVEPVLGVPLPVFYSSYRLNYVSSHGRGRRHRRL
jgi:hypothetical protein